MRYASWRLPSFLLNVQAYTTSVPKYPAHPSSSPRALIPTALKEHVSTSLAGSVLLSRLEGG